MFFDSMFDQPGFMDPWGEDRWYSTMQRRREDAWRRRQAEIENARAREEQQRLLRQRALAERERRARAERSRSAGHACEEEQPAPEDDFPFFANPFFNQMRRNSFPPWFQNLQAQQPRPLRANPPPKQSSARSRTHPFVRNDATAPEQEFSTPISGDEVQGPPTFMEVEREAPVRAPADTMEADDDEMNEDEELFKSTEASPCGEEGGLGFAPSSKDDTPLAQDSGPTIDETEEIEPATAQQQGNEQSEEPEPGPEHEQELAKEAAAEAMRSIAAITATAEEIKQKWSSAFTPITCEEDRQEVAHARAFLEEGLLMQVIQLDGVESGGNVDVRKARKGAVTAMEDSVAELHAFAAANDFDKQGSSKQTATPL